MLENDIDKLSLFVEELIKVSTLAEPCHAVQLRNDLLSPDNLCGFRGHLITSRYSLFTSLAVRSRLRLCRAQDATFMWTVWALKQH